jgi:hypothetical protein
MNADCDVVAVCTAISMGNHDIELTLRIYFHKELDDIDAAAIPLSAHCFMTVSRCCS